MKRHPSIAVENFSNFWKSKNQLREVFPILGKVEISFGRLSQFWEKQKSTSGGFPNFGKSKNQLREAFPTLGKAEIDFGRLSQLWEEQKSTPGDIPNFGKSRNQIRWTFYNSGSTKKLSRIRSSLF
jgi:hypothetical protein